MNIDGASVDHLQYVIVFEKTLQVGCKKNKKTMNDLQSDEVTKNVHHLEDLLGLDDETDDGHPSSSNAGDVDYASLSNTSDDERFISRIAEQMQQLNTTSPLSTQALQTQPVNVQTAQQPTIATTLQEQARENAAELERQRAKMQTLEEQLMSATKSAKTEFDQMRKQVAESRTNANEIRQAFDAASAQREREIQALQSKLQTAQKERMEAETERRRLQAAIDAERTKLASERELLVKESNEARQQIAKESDNARQQLAKESNDVCRRLAKESDNVHQRFAKQSDEVREQFVKEERQRLAKEADEERQRFVKEVDKERQRFAKHADEQRQQLAKEMNDERQRLAKEAEEQRQRLVKEADDARQRFVESNEERQKYAKTAVGNVVRTTTATTNEGERRETAFDKRAALQVKAAQPTGPKSAPRVAPAIVKRNATAQAAQEAQLVAEKERLKLALAGAQQSAEAAIRRCKQAESAYRTYVQQQRQEPQHAALLQTNWNRAKASLDRQVRHAQNLAQQLSTTQASLLTKPVRRNIDAIFE